MQSVYGINRDEAYAIVQTLSIIHPYGTLSDVPFGGHPYNSYDYPLLASQIKTYTEQVSDPKILEKMSRAVTSAECMVFLGFAYHSQNMMLLKPSPPSARVPVFGTAFGMSNADVEVVEQQVLEFFGPAKVQRTKEKVIRLENDLKSFELFDWYSSGGD